MRQRATAPKRATTRRPSVREAQNHCEARNDRHVGYCREPGRRVFRHPRGNMGILFVCSEHAMEALAEGKELLTSTGPVGGDW